MKEAVTTGKLVMPTGRFYTFQPEKKRDDLVWPRTTILNYPVQGLGADLMCIARVSFSQRFKKEKINGVLVSTVHDSIVVDVEDSETEQTCQLFHDVFDDLPMNFERIFKHKFDLPSKCEVLFGPDLDNLTEYKPVV